MTEFAEFIAPFDPQTFRAEYYGKRPLVFRNEGSNRPNILPWKRFNEVLGIAPYWNEDTLKVFYKSRAAPRENYCDTADLRPGEKAPASPAKVQALLGLGASLVANHLHCVCPEVHAVANMLEREFGAGVGANVYCSFQGVQAFQTHFDLHDVFAVQTEGEKTWRVYEGRADAPVSVLPPGEEVEKWLMANRGPLLFEVVMKPGDILYLPRGQYHDALTGAQASLHVTFGSNPPTGLALFKLLERATKWEGEFRAYLPDARNETELRERLARLADRLKVLMLSPGFLTDVLDHQRGLARPPALYELPVQRKPAWYSVLVRPTQVVRRDTGFILQGEGRQIPLGGTHLAVDWARQQRYFSLEDALARYPSVDPAEFRNVIDTLMKAGVIAETEMQT